MRFRWVARFETLFLQIRLQFGFDPEDILFRKPKAAKGMAWFLFETFRTQPPS